MSLLPKADLTDAVTLRPVGVDDISSIRYVHSTSFRILAAEEHTEEEVAAHVDLIQRKEYADEILSSDVTAAWVEDEMVGTAGWGPADDSGTTARIRSVFVRPLFTKCGIGRMLVTHVEAKALKAGFKDFSVRANINSVSFYEKLGFEITSYGVMPTLAGVDLPVAFMRKHEDAVMQSVNQRGVGDLKPVTHEGYWNHTTEH